MTPKQATLNKLIKLRDEAIQEHRKLLLDAENDLTDEEFEAQVAKLHDFRERHRKILEEYKCGTVNNARS